MTIWKQISLLKMVEKDQGLDLGEVVATLNELKEIIEETGKDSKAHRWHFLHQRLTGFTPPEPREAVEKQDEELKLDMGNTIHFAGQRLKFAMFRGNELLAMDEKGNERTIPKLRWKEIKKL